MAAFISLPARLALEVWRASGVRSLNRLDALAHTFADQYREDPVAVEREARSGVRAWEVVADVPTRPEVA